MRLEISSSEIANQPRKHSISYCTCHDWATTRSRRPSVGFQAKCLLRNVSERHDFVGCHRLSILQIWLLILRFWRRVYVWSLAARLAGKPGEQR